MLFWKTCIRVRLCASSACWTHTSKYTSCFLFGCALFLSLGHPRSLSLCYSFLFAFCCPNPLNRKHINNLKPATALLEIKTRNPVADLERKEHKQKAKVSSASPLFSSQSASQPSIHPSVFSFRWGCEVHSDVFIISLSVVLAMKCWIFRRVVLTIFTTKNNRRL